MNHRFAANGAYCQSHTSIQQTHKVVYLRHGAHRRAWILVGCLLLNGYHRTQPFDLIHIGTLHVSNKVTSIGRERLHIATLSLGIYGVERQRRLAAATQTREHYQLVARDLYVDILQIVLASTKHLYL